MKKIINLLMVLIMIVILPKNVLAENAYSLDIKCDPTQAVADDATKKYTMCEVSMDNSNSVVGETDSLNFTIKYNQIKNGNDLTITSGNSEAILGSVTKDDNGASFTVTMGAVPQSKFVLFKVKAVVDFYTPTPNSGSTIKVSGQSGETEIELNFTDTYSIDFSSITDICKKLTLDIDNNRRAYFAKENGYIYAVYNIENIENTKYEQCYGLAGIKGTVDLTTLPEGLKLVDGFLSDVNSEEATSLAGMQLNATNGEWVIDFDLAEKSLELQNQNTLSFALKFEISDSTKINDLFSITMKDFSFVNARNTDVTYFPKLSLISDFQATIKGDWNTNGVFELTDLIRYRKYLVDLFKMDEKTMQIIDLNSDGEVNLLDLIAARKVLVGLPIN